MTLYKLVTVLVLMHNMRGSLGAEVKGYIIGGHNAPKGGWPWMVYLNFTSDGINSWRCGGTILNNQWVLTAANCWNRSPAPNVRRSMAWVGSHSLQEASVRYMGIETVVTPYDFKALDTGFLNDLAMVKLKKKLTFTDLVASVSLPPTDVTFDPSSECWITGWGYVEPDVPLSGKETLQELMVHIIDDTVCKQQYPEMTEGMMCAGDINGGKDACNGDYGGPLVCRTATGIVQVGIMSYGSCGLSGRPGVYTKVSTYLNFIKHYMQQ